MPATETGETSGRTTFRIRPNSPKNPEQPSACSSSCFSHETLRLTWGWSPPLSRASPRTRSSRKANALPRVHYKTFTVQIKGSNSDILFWSGLTLILCLVLSAKVEERYWQNGTCSEEGKQGDKKVWETNLLRRGWGSWAHVGWTRDGWEVHW